MSEITAITPTRSQVVRGRVLGPLVSLAMTAFLLGAVAVSWTVGTVTQLSRPAHGATRVRAAEGTRTSPMARSLAVPSGAALSLD